MTVQPTDQVDVVIVSAFGRGNWLAVELVERAMSVRLIDLSDSLGRWAPEDWEGPFGFFQADHLTTLQVSRLTEEDYHDIVDAGFTVWPKEGPLDTRGPLVHYWLENEPVMAIAKRYIQAVHAASRTERDELTEELWQQGFGRNWLAQLAHQLASPKFLPNALAAQIGQPLPLFAPFWIRRVTRRGLQKSLAWAKERGVDVVSGARLEDIASENKAVTAVQTSGDRARVSRPGQVVWGLSSAETQFVAPRVAEKLYPEGALPPEWCWMRWRVQGRLGVYADVVPGHFVLIGDLGLPWTHDNLVVVQKCTVADTFDVWARIPAQYRFQRAYCEEFGSRLVAMLNGRIPDFAAQVLDYPQDYHYNEVELGPSLFPVFSASARTAWRAREYRNLHYDGVEWVENLDWTGRFARQGKILGRVAEWKAQQLAKAAKGGASDRSLHAP